MLQIVLISAKQIWIFHFTGAIAEFTSVSSDTLVSTLTFSNVTAGVLNQTEIHCISTDGTDIRNVEMVTLAGEL